MNKDLIELLKSLKDTTNYNDIWSRAEIDRVVYRLENNLPINYYTDEEDKRNRIIKIAKDFDKKSIKTKDKIEESKLEKPKQPKQPKKASKKEAK